MEPEFFSFPPEAYTTLIEFLPAETASILSGTTRKTQKTVRLFNQSDAYWLTKLKELLDTSEINLENPNASGEYVSPKDLYIEVYKLSRTNIPGWKYVLRYILGNNPKLEWLIQGQLYENVEALLEQASGRGLVLVLARILEEIWKQNISLSDALHKAIDNDQQEATRLLIFYNADFNDNNDVVENIYHDGSREPTDAEVVYITYRKDSSLASALWYDMEYLVKLILESESEELFELYVNVIFAPGPIESSESIKLLLESPQVSESTKEEILLRLVVKDTD